MVRKIFLVALGVILADFAMADPYNQCISLRDGSEKIKACSSFLNSSQRKPRGLACNALLHRADAYLGSLEIELGLLDINKFIDCNPNNAQAYLIKGALLYFKGAIADDSIANASKKPPAEAMEFYRQSLIYYNKAIYIDPQFWEAYSKRASSYHALLDYDKAVFDYSMAISGAPDNPLYYSLRALMYNLIGDIDKAIVDYKKAIELSDDGQFKEDNKKALNLIRK